MNAISRIAWAGLIIGGVLLVNALAVRPASAFGLTVKSGAELRLNSANSQIDLNCLDLTVIGQLFGDAGSFVEIQDVLIEAGGEFFAEQSMIEFSRDWQNLGLFDPGSSMVNLVDGCGATSSLISGNTTFDSFSATTTIGHDLIVEAGSEQTFNSNLTLTGAAGGMLTISSTSAGEQAAFNLLQGGSQTISYVDVTDNNATGQTLAPNFPAAFNSVDSGNATNWFIAVFNRVRDIPAMGPLGLMLLLGLMIFAARDRLVRANRSTSNNEVIV